MFDKIILFLQFILYHHGNIPIKKFISTYGVHLNTAMLLYHCASSFDDCIAPIYILMFLDWIRHYPTVDEISQKWHCDPKTFRKRSYLVLFALFLTLDSVSFYIKIFLFFLFNYLF